MVDPARSSNQVILVLGAGIIGFLNRQRARTAFYYDSNTPIIPTGGKGGFLGSLMGQTEAEYIQSYLSRLGAGGRVIQLETKARTTRENFRNSKTLLELVNPETVLVVTNKHHMPRALEIAREFLPGYKIEPLSTKPETIPERVYEGFVWLYEHTKIPIENYLKSKRKPYKTPSLAD